VRIADDMCGVRQGAVAPDGSRFVLTHGAQACTPASLWSATGEKLANLEGRALPHAHEGSLAVKSFGFCARDGAIAIGARNGTITLWTANGEYVGGFVANARAPDALLSLATDPIGDLIFVGVRKEGQLWSWKGARIGTLRVRGYKVSSVAFSTNGQRLLTISDDPSGERTSGFVQLWNRQARLVEDLRVLTSSSITRVEFDDSDRYLLLGGTSDVRVFDMDGRLLGVIAAAQGVYVRAQAVSPSGDLIAALFSDGVVRLWSYPKEQCTVTIRANSTGPIFFSPDGRWLIVALASGDFEQHPLDISDLFERSAKRLTRGFTQDEIERFGIQHPVRLDFDALRSSV
jgi:WD40 repeat protein